MRHVAWRASLNTRTEGATDPKVTDLASLRVRARKGDKRAQAELRGPRYPEWTRYLLEWSHDFARGAGEFSEWANVDAWARRKKIDPEPHEIDAVLTLVNAMRHPEHYLKRAG